MSTEEIVNRIGLWNHSIMKTQSLLRLHYRAKAGIEKDCQKKEYANYISDFKAYIKSRPDFKPNSATTTQHKDFNSQYIREFPTLEECMSIWPACIELAIIYFCQILSSGDAEENYTAKNDRVFREKYLPLIVQKIFSNKEELEKFNTLCSQLKEVRDTLIGHADGTAYVARTQGPIRTVSVPGINWQKDVDIDFWYSFLEKMRIETLNFNIELRK